MAIKYLDDTGTSELVTKVKNLVATKQDTLVSGTTIKTINNTSLLGSGNISISGADVSGKVDKTSTSNQVYATDSNGDQTTIGYSATADANTIVKRIPTGDIDVPATPTYLNSSASKLYVDKVSQYDFLYQGYASSGTFTISNITNYKYLILAFKYITTENLHAWDTSIIPADYIASEISANRPFALHAGDNAGSNIRSVIINFLSNTSISIGYASNIAWCVLWGVGK